MQFKWGTIKCDLIFIAVVSVKSIINDNILLYFKLLARPNLLEGLLSLHCYHNIDCLGNWFQPSTVFLLIECHYFYIFGYNNCKALKGYWLTHILSDSMTLIIRHLPMFDHQQSYTEMKAHDHKPTE